MDSDAIQPKVNDLSKQNSTISQNRSRSSKSTVIDMSKVKTGTATHRPSLPNVLLEYGYPTKIKAKKPKSKSAGHKRPDETKRERSGMSTLERDEKNRLRDLRLSHILDDPEKGRGYMYEEYMARMKVKLANQREEIERKNHQLEMEIKNREDKLKQEIHRARKKLMQRHGPIEIKKGIYQSKYHKLLKLQDQLEKEGKLQSVSDYDAFREDMDKSTVYEDLFKKHGDSDIGSLSDQSHMSSHQPSYHSASLDEEVKDSVFGLPSKHEFHRSLTEIDEMSEASSMPFSKERMNSKAMNILQTIEAKEKRKEKEKHAHELISSNITSKNAKQEFEKRYPKTEMPKLACFTLNLEETPPDPEEVQRLTELHAQENGRRNYIKKLKRMYQLSIAHTASSKRILEKHTSELSLLMEARNLKDLTESYQFEPQMVQQETHEPDIAILQRIYKAGGRFSPIMELSEPPSALSRPFTQQHRIVAQSPYSDSVSSAGDDTKRIKTRKSRSSATPSVQSEGPKPQQKHPLTLNRVEFKEKIIEPKCQSTYWTNYAGAGKSVFAK